VVIDNKVTDILVPTTVLVMQGRNVTAFWHWYRNKCN